MDQVVDKVRVCLCKLNESVKSSEINKFLEEKVRAEQLTCALKY